VSSYKRALAITYLLDKAGMWTSAICMLHCITLPLLISASAFNGLLFLDDHRIEGTVIGISVLLGTSSLLPSYSRHHRKIFPVLILLSGFVVIGVSRVIVNVNESVLTSSGAALVASAHFFNFRLCKKWHNRI
jgi:hypothetical protein